MSSKANTQHLRLINKLKRVKEYKNDGLAITIETWNYRSGSKKTEVTLWSSNKEAHIFKGSTMVALERFINKEREKAGLFKGRATKLKGERNEG